MEGVGVEWTDPFSIVSPKAVRTAAEYFLPLFVPTVVPSMSLKYDVPVDDTTGFPPPMCGSFMNDASPRLTSARPSQRKDSEVSP